MIEEEVGAAIQACDPEQKLHSDDFQDALCTVSHRVFTVMCEQGRAQFVDEDRAYIRATIRKMVSTFLSPAAPTRRFLRFEHVLVNVGGRRQWAAGVIQALNEDDPADESGRAPKLPYVVKSDPPDGRLVSVPEDANTHVRAEVCFGQRAGALYFTLFSLPPTPRPATKQLRFAVRDRVACAVEDGTDDFSNWAAGTVLGVDQSIEAEAKAALPDWTGQTRVPYRVRLDSGCEVLVHRDEHWLVRGLAHQREGPRQAEDGSRCLKRLEVRKVADGWEVVDHATGQVRSCASPNSSDDDD